MNWTFAVPQHPTKWVELKQGVCMVRGQDDIEQQAKEVKGIRKKELKQGVGIQCCNTGQYQERV